MASVLVFLQDTVHHFGGVFSRLLAHLRCCPGCLS